MDKAKIHSCLAIGSGIAAAVLFGAFLITIVAVGAVGWWLIFALTPLTVVALMQ
ncbi:MAG: hypothetical protein LBT55_08190 [Clostridiaceae bacterium]|nr:hypothetical protein [Clostridiaceae bacterium]